MTSRGSWTPEAEAEVRSWIRRVAARSSPPLESHVVETGTGRTHMLRSGEVKGRAIVCLPGWGMCAAFWAAAGQLTPLSDVGPVLVLDVPGQPGLSAAGRLPDGSAGPGLWLSEVLDALGAGDVDLVGASLGGLLGVRAALSLGDRVRRLVLLAPAGFVLPLTRPRALVEVLRYRRSPSPERAARFVGECLLGGVQPLDTAVHAELAGALSRSAHGYEYGGLPPIWLKGRELGSLRTKSLLLLGERDPIFSPRGTVRRAGRVLGAPFEHDILPDHGHSLELSGSALGRAAEFLRR